ncbi:uncharacterized protein LOC123262795 [Cotesia glomerata]|uniref:uncharacterized protein LOC123262795 n=1 Tax=Cotesia glomerata TaxID=32391 RepID=UPI001D019563|nr:uncharacterized protein LOC123262795 [Cotesia glomerata]
MTPEMEKLSRVYIEETKYREKLQSELKVLTEECEKLREMLKSKECTCNVNRSPGLQILSDVNGRNVNRKKGGERYTHQEMLFAIGIYKRSPKCYSYLLDFMQLPSESTLKRAFSKISLKPGINPVIFEALSKAAKRLDPKDLYCSVVMDETTIKSRVMYYEGSDSLIGYHDDGENVKPELADHVTVFMLQSINFKGRQPLSFHFTKGPMSTVVLYSFIKKIIRLINDTGFKVVATICDQGFTNRGAFKMLADETLESWDNSFFKLPEHPLRIHIFFDISHLIKTSRNNFSGTIEIWSKDNPSKHRSEYSGNIIEFNGRRGYWKDVVQLYYADPDCHLKEDHIYLTNTSKMNVDLAGQVLSSRLAQKLNAIGSSNPEIYPTACDTGIVIEELDTLFDSLNGSKISGVDRKIQSSRAPVTSTSYHWDYWNGVLKSLDTFRYVKLLKDGTEKKIDTPTPAALKNNVKAAKGLCSFLLEKAGLESINLRLVTQDALENLFGLIKNLQGCNHTLTALHFCSAFKNTLLTTFAKFRAPGSNCENEDLPAMIELEDLLTAKITEELENESTNEASENSKAIFDDFDPPQIHLEDNNEDLNFFFNLNEPELVNDAINSTNDLKISDPILDSMAKYLKKNCCPNCKSCIFEKNSRNTKNFTSIETQHQRRN